MWLAAFHQAGSSLGEGLLLGGDTLEHTLGELYSWGPSAQLGGVGGLGQSGLGGEPWPHHWGYGLCCHLPSAQYKEAGASAVSMLSSSQRLETMCWSGTSSEGQPSQHVSVHQTWRQVTSARMLQTKLCLCRGPSLPLQQFLGHPGLLNCQPSEHPV